MQVEGISISKAALSEVAHSCICLLVCMSSIWDVGSAAALAGSLRANL